jgi:SAM-dependent methyltransferase
VSLLELLEHPRIYGFTQKLNPMTVSLYRALVAEHVARGPAGAVLDIGCGVGAHRPLFPGWEYAGIDLNPRYVEMAVRAYGGGFRVMDAGAIDFPDHSFDAAFSVATCHHLDDARVLAMVTEALRVVRPEGALHIVDPVLPVSPRAVVKRSLFLHDRGRHQRTTAELTRLLSERGRVTCTDVRSGVLHDVCYVRLSG